MLGKHGNKFLFCDVMSSCSQGHNNDLLSGPGLVSDCACLYSVTALWQCIKCSCLMSALVTGLVTVILSFAMQNSSSWSSFLSILYQVPELVLRKVINFADCTVCLDKRNASGKIEFYQDPLLYKCSFRTRLHFTYDNINSKIPSVIKVSSINFKILHTLGV